MLFVLNKIVNSQDKSKVDGYTCLNLDKYTILYYSKNDLNRHIYWGRQEKSLFYESRLPYIFGNHNTSNLIYNMGILVVGILNVKVFNENVYMISLGDKKFKLFLRSNLIEYIQNNHFNVINIDKTISKIGSNKQSLPILDTKVILNKLNSKSLNLSISKDLYEALLKCLNNQSEDDITFFEKQRLDNIRLLKEREDKLKNKSNISQNSVFSSYCKSKVALDSLNKKDKGLQNYFSDYFPNTLERKDISDVQIDVNMDLEELRNYCLNLEPSMLQCSDSDCIKFVKDLKNSAIRHKQSEIARQSNYKGNKGLSIGFTYMLSHYENQLSAIKSNYNKDFRIPPCLYCSDIQKLIGVFYFKKKPDVAGFSTISSPNRIFVRTDKKSDFNLELLNNSYHEYIHYLSINQDLSGLEGEYTSYPMAYTIINEGVTELLSRYFIYKFCSDEYLKNNFLYNYEGKKIELSEVEKQYSPFLKDLKTLKNVSTYYNVYDFGDYFHSLPLTDNRIVENSGYKYNSALVFFICHLIGLENMLKCYFGNDVYLLNSLIIEKIGEEDTKSFFEALENTNDSCLSKQNYINIVKYIEDGELIELF